MIQRIITGTAIVAVSVPLLIWSHTHVFTVAVALLALVAIYEMLGCIGVRKKLLIALPSYAMALVPVLAVRFIDNAKDYGHFAFAGVLVFLLYLGAYSVLGHNEIKFNACAEVFMTVIYISAGFTSLLLLRDSARGNYVFWLVFMGAWVTDTMAYFTGMLFGKHKLIEAISPKKTLEGAIGGTFFCALVFGIYGFVLTRYGASLNVALIAVAGIVAAVVAQLGDLFASVIKREHGVKDYGQLFPGHGGVLDRFDSIIALAPVILLLYGG